MSWCCRLRDFPIKSLKLGCFQVHISSQDHDMPEVITGIGEMTSPIDPDKDELLVSLLDEVELPPSPRVRESMQQVMLNALSISAPHSPSTLLVVSL